jgi:hypothetical protein
VKLHADPAAAVVHAVSLARTLPALEGPMENRFVQLVPAVTSNGNVGAFYALDAQGTIWYGPIKFTQMPSIEWHPVESTRK